MKKILVVSAIALGLSSVALAGGIAEKMPAAPVATAAVAKSDFNPGIYVGLQGGYADSGLSALPGDFVNNDKGIAGRVFVGYDFHKHFAIEAGYFLMRKASLFLVPADIKTQAFDLVGKMKVNVVDNFGLYAKAGIGYLMNSNNRTDITFNILNSKRVDLVYGLGAYYNIDNFTVDLSYTRYNSGHSKIDQNWQPNVDFYALGVSYKFDL
jgi:opacity protein-like surface antigen